MHSGKPRRKHHEEVTCALLSELGVVFEREVVVHFPVPARRKYARVDVFWRTAFGAVIFEVDEYAHRGYEVEYECQRMILIQKALSAKLGGHLHIIRYNPHPIRGLPAPTRDERELQIRSALEYEPKGLAITYLFYHKADDGYPEIALSPGYNLRQHIRIQNASPREEPWPRKRETEERVKETWKL